MHLPSRVYTFSTLAIVVLLAGAGTTQSAAEIDRFLRTAAVVAAGGFQKNFGDSYRFEIAAYELDRLIGTGLVPPTVERRWCGKTGSLQLWVEDAMTDLERQDNETPIPDPARWNRQVKNLELFRLLTYDVDYVNARDNVIDPEWLIDPEWRLWAVDSSGAFSPERELFDETLEPYSRRVFRRTNRLNRDSNLWSRRVEARGALRT